MVEGPQMTDEWENAAAWVVVMSCAVCGFSIIIADWISRLRDKKVKSKYKQGEKT